MNAGAAASDAGLLLFLHADCALPPDAGALIRTALERRPWGRFDVRIAGLHPLLTIISAMMNFRSRATKIATGDQAMFMTRDTFARAGGFPDLPLMEDIAMSKRLKRIGPPFCLSATVTTSGRRWERNGIIRTILLMWRLRLAYFFGAEPTMLARRYGYAPHDG
jgi:rSAM/selenodomain-associated transferase 2